MIRPGPVGAISPARTDDQRLGDVESYLENERTKQGIPGLSVSIARQERILWSKALGWADIENEVPVTQKTVFPLAGITRMMTATAVLQLARADRLSLDASIREYVPELPDKGTAITIVQVLSNTAGFRHFKSEEDFYNRKHYPTLLDAVGSFKDDRLGSPPGAAFRMSTPAYNLLGLLIERVSGDPLGVYFHRQIFDPAGMTNSRVDGGREIIRHRARGYSLDPSRRVLNAPLFDASDRLPVDGVWATADDVSRFALALLAHRLIDREMFQRMTTPARTRDGKEIPYGFGCFVREVSGYHIFGHGGRLPNASSFLLVFPGERLAITVLTNLDRADVQELALGMAERLMDNFNPDEHATPNAEPAAGTTPD